jgi:hypothetical protein
MTRRWRNVLSPCHIVGDDRQIAPLTVVTSVELYLAEIIRPLFKGYRRLAVAMDAYVIFFERSPKALLAR